MWKRESSSYSHTAKHTCVATLPPFDSLRRLGAWKKKLKRECATIEVAGSSFM